MNRRYPNRRTGRVVSTVARAPFSIPEDRKRDTRFPTVMKCLGSRLVWLLKFKSRRIFQMWTKIFLPKLPFIKSQLPILIGFHKGLDCSRSAIDIGIGSSISPCRHHLSLDASKFLRRISIAIIISLFFLPSFSIAQDQCNVEPMHPCNPCGPGAAIYAGYLISGNPMDFQITAEENGLGGVTERQYDYSTLSGFIFGGQLQTKLSSCTTAFVSSSITAPIVADLRAEDYDPPDNLLGGRSWKSDTIWGTVEGLLGYSVLGRAWILGGFRWDFWQTSLTEPTNASLGFVAHSETDTASLTLNGYVPLIGVAASASRITLGALGFPRFYGDFKYAENRNGGGIQRLDKGSGRMNGGYMVEAFAEYSHPVIRMGEHVSGNFSIFGQFNTVEAESVTQFSRTGGIFQNDTFNFTFRRNIFVVGGKIAINFTVPLSWL
jgi:hypothetical protein